MPRTCNRCGRPLFEHETNPYTGRPVRCPTRRQRDVPRGWFE